jgi:hypothetical protein
MWRNENLGVEQPPIARGSPRSPGVGCCCEKAVEFLLQHQSLDGILPRLLRDGIKKRWERLQGAIHQWERTGLSV